MGCKIGANQHEYCTKYKCTCFSTCEHWEPTEKCVCMPPFGGDVPGDGDKDIDDRPNCPFSVGMDDVLKVWQCEYCTEKYKCDDWLDSQINLEEMDKSFTVPPELVAEFRCQKIGSAGHGGGDHPYKSLEDTLQAAIDQASTGKGKERHAVDNAFEEQVICAVQRLLTNHPFGGQAFQVIKKTIEAGRLYQNNGPDAAYAEVLGAINYLAAMGILIQEAKGRK